MLKPLARAEFQAIIRQVVSELKRKYRDRLLYVAAYGSLARGAETPLSDIDLLAIVDKGASENRAWLYDTTSVEVRVLPLETVKERILRVDMLWPHEVGSLLKHKVYLDWGRTAENLRRWHARAVRTLKRPVEPYAGFYEYFGKMARGWGERNSEVMRRAAWEIFFMSCMDLALVNKRFYSDHMRMTEEIEGFDLVPEGFLEHARNLFHSDLGEVYRAAQGLFKIHLQLARERGYEMKPLDRVEKIRIE